MVDVDMSSTPSKVIGRSFYVIKRSWTQKTSKHLKEGGVKGNKKLHEGGRWKCAS
jgi:hypothetical protein